MKQFFITLFLVLLIFFPSFVIFGSSQEQEKEAILLTAESFFKSLKEKNFSETWKLLSRKSKNTITEEVYNNLKGKVSKEKIYEDFEKVGPLAQAYWNGFLSTFNPDLVLEHCKWEFGKINRDKAEIILTYEKSKNPAILQMFKEAGMWRVGLVETFWTRKK